MVHPTSVEYSEAVQGVHIKTILENNVRFDIPSLLKYIFHNNNILFIYSQERT